MPEGVRAGAVYYDVAFSRETLKAVRQEAQRLGKELDDVVNKPAKPAGGAGGVLPKLKDDAKEAAAELRRLQDEEKSGVITRDQYRQSVDRLRGEMRGMVAEVDRGSREYDTLTKAVGRSTQVLDRLEKQDVDRAIAGINNEVFALRNQLESGAVTEDAFRNRMRELITESHRLTQAMVDQDGAVARTTSEYRKASNAAGGAERALATLEGRTTKLGLSQQIVVGGTSLLEDRLRSLGPAGDLAAGALGIMNSQGDQLAEMFGVRLPAAMQNSLKVITTLQVVAPVALGAATFALFRLANQAAETADEVHKGAVATGLSIESYQELQFVFDQSGISADQYRNAIGSLSRRLGEAAHGNKAYADAYARLGIATRDANGDLRETEEIMLEALDALSRLPSTAEQASTAAKLFGDDVGKNLVPVIAQGADGIEALREQARELGLILSGDAVLSLVEYKDEMAALSQQFQTARIEIVASFLPVLQDVVIPLLQDTVVPLVQTWAEELDTVGATFVSTGAAGTVFRANIADQVTPLVQFVNLLRAAGAGLNLLDVRFQLVGRRIGDFLGTGDLAWQRALEQFMGTHPLLQDIDVPDLVGWADALGGESADAEQLRQWADEYDADLRGYIENVRNAGGDVNAALEEFVQNVTTGRDAANRALAGLDVPGDPGEPGAPGAGTSPGSEDDPLAAARLWVGRLTSEVEFGMKEAGEALGLLQPRAAELEDELRSLHEEGLYGSDAWKEAAAKAEILQAAIENLTTAASTAGAEESITTTGRRPASAGGLATDWAAQRAAEQRDLTRAIARAAGERVAAEEAASERLIAGRERTSAHIARIVGEEQATLARAIERERERQEAAAQARVDARERTSSIIRNLIEADQRDLTRAIERERERQEAAQAAADARRVEGRESTSQRIRHIVEEEQRALTRAIERGREERAAAEREAAARITRDNVARGGMRQSIIDAGKAADDAEGILEEYGERMEAAGIQAALFGETHELSARQAELTRQAIETLVPILGVEHETVQDLIDAWEGYTAAAEGAGEETASLADHFGNAEQVLSSLGGAAGGTLGDVISGFGEVAGIAKDIASGNYLSAATSFISEVVGAITAIGEAGAEAREELRLVQEDLNLIDVDDLTVTSRQKAGQFLFIPIYAEVEVLPENIQAVAESIQAGIVGGMQNARDIILAGGSREEVEEAIHDGIEQAVMDAILQGVIQGAVVEGALRNDLAAITEAAAEGNWDEVRRRVTGLADDVELVADELGNAFDAWADPAESIPDPTDDWADPAVGIADSLAAGVESGLSRGVRSYLESGNLSDLESGIEQGLFDSVTTALIDSLVQEGIIKGALGDLIPDIGAAFAAGDTERAIALSERVMDMVPGLAAALEPILGPLRGLRPDDGSSMSPTSPSGGVQVQEITGPTRDLFLDLFSPLKALDSVPAILSRTYDLLATRLPAPSPGAGSAAMATRPTVVFEEGAVQISGGATPATATSLRKELSDVLGREFRALGY